jgi:hypothetical protein
MFLDMNKCFEFEITHNGYSHCIYKIMRYYQYFDTKTMF